MTEALAHDNARVTFPTDAVIGDEAVEGGLHGACKCGRGPYRCAHC